MKNRLIVFVWNGMLVGGIETYIYQEMKKLKSEGYHVAQVISPDKEIDEAYLDFMTEENVIFIDNLQRDILSMHCKRLKVDRLQIITFDMFPFVEAEKIKKEIDFCIVDTFMFVPHFLGDSIYLEEGYSGKKREKVRKKISNIIHKMNDNSNIRYFAKKHIETMEDHYGIIVKDPQNMIVPKEDIPQYIFDEKKRLDIYKREEFRIVTASRLDFPHKAYILGLIDAYGKIKETYPKVTLEIIGDGEGITELRKKINELDENIRNDIILSGTLSPEKLERHYDLADLSISVAGCLGISAGRGVISIPARHYDYNCEVYGFLPESWDKRLSSEPGEPVIPYIEKVMNMSEEEYLSLSKDSYECRMNSLNITFSISFSELENNESEITLSDKDIRYVQKLQRVKFIKEMRRVMKIKFKEEGFLKPTCRKIKKILLLKLGK